MTSLWLEVLDWRQFGQFLKRMPVCYQNVCM
uniref:Uncharacterized protein n=1 Tax=Anguilla anguilla TaxID=7936 RepID=A0A0E9R6I6_ANGAN